MRTLSFWLLCVAMLCGLGSGLATLNNISQIGESLGYTARERTTMVSLWSIWNFLGRFGSGLASDIFMHLKGWPKPLFMWCLMPTITSEIFGVQHMGTIFNTIAVANPVGSYILSVLSFFILAAVSFVGALVALVFMFKARALYARIIRTSM
ncbi:hypothetical protein Salat_1491200 [Sesamum alatum]|uniref:Uncharacterized protein n=1 Tax=Sesamum alatum TaxID=300844 RepID=A0AAE1YBS1_9LAMI|nr:hypothetical protein Salat_1491200 [Sesamum alatum]